jgi:hypothetical protein
MRALDLGFRVLASMVSFGLLAQQPVNAATPAAEARASGPPAAVDLRPTFDDFGIVPRKQGERPTCSVFTVVGALEFAAAKRQGHTPRLSVEFLNWAANKACGEMEDGGYFSDLWKGFIAYGICAEANMPYESKLDTNRQPSAVALADAKTRLPLDLRLHWIKEWNVHTGLTAEHLTTIKRTLDSGWPVCSGLRWPKQQQWVENVLQMCPSNAVRDGHSVLLVGYRDDAAQPGGGVFIFRNTSRSGQDGSMPYAYAREYMNDAVWVDCERRTNAPTAPAAVSPLRRDPLGALTTLPAGRNRPISSNEQPKAGLNAGLAGAI